MITFDSSRARFLGVSGVIASCLFGSSLPAGDIGGTPWYEYEIIAEIGSSKTGSARLTREINPAQPGFPPITFNHAINDAGEVLLEATFLDDITDPDKKVIDSHRVIGRPGQLVLDQVGKGTPFYQGAGGLSLVGTIYSGNDIFVAGNLINPAGSICGITLDDQGFPKPCDGIQPLSGTISRNGRISLIGLDTRRLAERSAPWLGVYDVLSFGGGGSALQQRVPLAEADTNDALLLSGWVHLAAADTGRLVIGEFDGPDRRIAVIEPDGLVRDLERLPAAFGPSEYVVNPTLSLVPSITADGEFVAYARREPDGSSDSIVIVQPTLGTPFDKPTVVFSTTNVIALQSNFSPIRFSRIGMQPVSIVRHDVGEDGRIDNDTLWLLFAARPDAASRENPHRPGVPLLIRDSIGIWAIRVDIRRNLPTAESLVLHPSGPIPVLQIGDTFRGQPIRFIDLSRSLGRGTADRLGNLRSPTRQDHVAAIRIETDAGPAIIRATHFDSDEDGLPDHWERPDGGIDADRDGEPDLRLSQFGADPLRKDLFIELDWLAPRRTGHPTGWRNEPHAQALDLLVELFATAPVTNSAGESGITLHIDAGPGRDRNGRSYSRNFPTGHQGGDEVTLDGGRPDIVQIGSPERRTVGPFQVAPLDAIKDRYFGTADRNAREFAFRYVLLGDFLGYQDRILDTNGSPASFSIAGVLGQRIAVSLPAPVRMTDFAPVWNMRWIGFLDGPSAGEVRRIQPRGINVVTNSQGDVTLFAIDIDGAMPAAGLNTGNHLTFLGNGITGISEAFLRATLPGPDSKNGHRLPGNDVIGSMASISASYPYEGLAAAQLGRLLAHELGHTLGLTHGGNETHCQYRGDIHWSLMSYTHQSRVDPAAPLALGGGSCLQPRTDIPPFPGLAPDAVLPGVVDSFSNGSDPLGFDEWSYARLETWTAPWLLGNSQMRYASVLPPIHPPGEPSPVETAADSLDVIPPRLSWITPAGPVRVAPGSPLTLEFDASDNVAIASLTATFDADGNGTNQGPTEILQPLPLGGTRHQATFHVSGPGGVRTLSLQAIDPTGNIARLTPRILVGDSPFPDTNPPDIEPGFPGDGASLPSSGHVAIQFRTGDREPDSGLLRTWIEFDVNGDGFVDPVSEIFHAVERQSSFAGSHTALLPQPTGNAGFRNLRLVSEDLWLNRATRNLNVRVAPPDLIPPTLVIDSGPTNNSVIDYGRIPIRLRLVATDDSGVAELAWAIDTNGDGILGSAERQVIPVGGGTSVSREINLSLNFTGPGGLRTLLLEAVDTTGNRTVVTRILRLEDRQPPSLWIALPGPFDPASLLASLVVSGTVTDNQTVSLLRLSFDANGDGTLSPTEIVTPSPGSQGAFTATFPTLQGSAGPRILNVLAEDPAGLVTRQSVPIEVIAGLQVHTPLDGDVWPIGSTHLVSLESSSLSSAPQQPVFRVRFDLDGDGNIQGSTEDQRVPGQPNDSTFTAPRHTRAVLALGSLSGPPGFRKLQVEIEGQPGSRVERTLHVEARHPSPAASLRLTHIPFTTSLRGAAGDTGSLARPFAALSNLVLFTALTPREGVELWSSDGTADGTRLLRDLNPGFSEGLSPQPLGSDPSDFVHFNGKIYFAATEQSGGFSTPTLGTGRELWVTDGTVNGTQLVRNINTNRMPAQTSDSSAPTSLVVFKNRIWFNAQDGRSGEELWTSDGTEAGTVQFMDIIPGQASSNPTRLTVAGDHLYFIIDQRALWRSDGTVAGTHRVYPADTPDFSEPGWRRLVAVGNRIFALRVAAGFHELWTSDGSTPGTHRLKVIAPFSSPFGEPEFAAAGNRLVFSAESTGTGRELWVSDGTEPGTTLLADLWPGGPDDLGRFPSGQPRLFTPLGNRAAFAALSPTIGDEPWITDGTLAGTRPMGDVAPNAGAVPSSIPTGSSPSGFVEGAGAIWFAAGDGNQRIGNELRRWDGLDSPSLVRDLAPLWVNRPLGNFGNYSGPASANPTALLPVGNRLFFRATDPIYGDELHVSDGTPTGTRRIRNLHPGSTRPRLLMRQDRSRLLASGYDGRLALLLDISQSGPIRSWATPAAAAADLLAEFNTGWMFVTTNGLPGTLRRAQLHDWRDNTPEPVLRLEALDIWRIVAGAGFTWAAGIHTNNSPVLWRIPPTGEPVVVANLGTNPSDTLFQSAELGGQLLFAAGGSLQRELWAGDANGVRTLQPVTGGTFRLVDRFHLFNNRLFFQATTNNLTEYWSTDGTDVGTTRFREESPAAGRPPSELQPVILNGKLLFSAVRFGVPHELWISDGTTEGTTALGRVFDPNRGELFARSIRHLTVAGDRAFFNATTVFGEELWVTDGSPEGTRMVANIARPTGGSFIDPGSDPTGITPIGTNVVFVAGSSAEGRELWFSNGSEAGTRPVRVLLPGPNSPAIAHLTLHGGRIFFTAKTPTEGRELWSTDGTAEGTVLVEDLGPGGMSSDPTDLLSFGDRLVYLAQDDGDDIALRAVGTTVSPYEAWLNSFPLPPGFPRDPAADGDGDGASNLLEFLYRTSPINPRDKFGFTSVRAVPGLLPTLEITYLRPTDWRALGMGFHLEFTQRFGGWSVLFPSRTTVENLGAMERVTVEVQAELRMDEFFVRLRLSGP